MNSPGTEEAAIATEGLGNEFSKLSFEEQELKRAAWKAELAQIDDEIATLRTVLAAKLKRSAELKRCLGITVWKEITEDVNQGIKNVKESHVYQTVEQKVGQVSKALSDAPIVQKTASIFGGFTDNIANKIGQIRQSDQMKSFEEKVGTAYENVKTKVISRPESMHNLNADRSRSGSVVTSPTIDEGRPIA